MSTQTLFKNESERLTDERLRLVCEEYGARVCPKVRVADILNVKKDSLAPELFSYALMAHFDFVIYDPQDLHSPLFAVEFDGESHSRPTQIARDKKKNQLCELSQFPLLRINSNFLSKSYRHKDILTYLVERYFLEKSFEEAQEQGLIPEEEGFDPTFLMVTQGGKTKFPLWLSKEILTEYQELCKAKIIRDHIPSSMIARDMDGNLRAIGWTLIRDGYGIVANTGMKAQLFDYGLTDAIEEIIIFETHASLKKCLEKKSAGVSLAVINKSITHFERQYGHFQSNTSGLLRASYLGKTND